MVTSGSLVSLFSRDNWCLPVRKQKASLFPRDIRDERSGQRAQNKVYVMEGNGNYFLKY